MALKFPRIINFLFASIIQAKNYRMSRAHFPTPGGLASRQALHAVPPGWEKRPLEEGASFAVRGPGPTVHCHRDSSEEEMVPVSVLLMDC